MASPTNIKPWSGLGGLGPAYSLATNCLLRDIADFPDKKIKTSATASIFLGNVTAEQEVGFLSFNKDTAVFEGYHRLRACGPAVGCLDAYTQKFKLTLVKTDKKGSGKKAGQYNIYEAHALDVWADGLAQGIRVELPGIMVPTPVGSIEAKPEFRFGRATGFVTAPYDGNYKSSFPDLSFGISKNKTFDIYGRSPGTDATNLLPVDAFGVDSPKGWNSQIALGSRDPDPKKPVWVQPPGVEFPARPDLDLTNARSAAEKTPNAYLGASVQATYSVINLIPKAIRDIGCSGTLRVCIDQAEVFAKPTIDVGYMSQVNVIQNEQNHWNGKLGPAGAVPTADLSPMNLDQSKSAFLQMNSAAAARFALDAGLDFVIRLEINTFFTKIKKNLVDLHPRTTIAEKIDKAYAAAKTAGAHSQATKILADKKYFQNYIPFKGGDLASGTVDGGANHIQACLAKPTAPGSLPPEPTYTPGDPALLVQQIEYPCNICVGWNEEHYKDNFGKNKVFPSYLATLLPASQAAKPASTRWKCKFVFQSGCYDMCKMDTAGKLSVQRTALKMLKAGEAKGMPSSCGRGK